MGTGDLCRVPPAAARHERARQSSGTMGVLCGVRVFCRILPGVWVLPRVEGTP